MNLPRDHPIHVGLDRIERNVKILSRAIDLADAMSMAYQSGDIDGLERALKDYHAFRLEHGCADDCG